MFYSMETTAAPASLAMIDLPQGRLEYRVAGPASSSHPPVVFVHGILVDCRLWEPVAERLAAEGIRSYAPTLPLGAHQRPMNPDADLSPGGIAQLIRDFIAALGLSNVTIVGNDTGGAICQVMLGGDTSQLGGVVLTNCDAFGTFPPRPLAPLFFALRRPGLVACMVPGLRSAWVRNGPLAFGPLAIAPLDRGLTRDWISPLARGAIRGDLARFAGAVHPRVLLDAASRFRQFTRPVRILWGEADPYFSVELAQQLSAAFPHALLTTVAGGRAFLPLDYPGEVASEIAAVVHGAP
jgi:pimeloyl-ACP methyl ester carboxylesterase